MRRYPIEILSKLEIAERQLNRAIILMLDEGDIVSSTTLAGAAEDVLAGLLEAQGKTDVLKEVNQACVDMGAMLGENWKTNIFKYEFNFIKNELKHHDRKHPDGGLSEMPIYPEFALELIERACENFRRLTGKYTNQMKRFNLAGYR